MGLCQTLKHFGKPGKTISFRAHIASTVPPIVTARIVFPKLCAFIIILSWSDVEMKLSRRIVVELTILSLKRHHLLVLQQ